MGKGKRLRDNRRAGDSAVPGAGTTEAGTSPPTDASKDAGPFDATPIENELDAARKQARDMVRGALKMFGPRGELYESHFPLMGFIERAQAFSLGAIVMIEAGNPLSAATLLRSLAENLATAFYVTKRPEALAKLQPGAEHGLPVGQVIAAAEKSLPGFKKMYDELSSMAHPSGAGGFHTLRADGNEITWQSHPRFKDASQAHDFLALLAALSHRSEQVITATVEQFALRDAAREGAASC